MSLFALSVLLLCAVGGATSLVVIWLDGLKSRPGAVHDGPAPRRRTSSPTTAARTRAAPIP